MVTLPRQMLLIAAAILSVLFLCQCQTQRSYGEVRRGSISFDEKSWGGQGGNSDEKEIRSKFAERGYTVSDDGTLVADKPNLYSGNKAKGMGGKVDKKQAKLQKNQSATKEFRTPEYLKRQNFAGVEQSRLGDDNAREGNFNESRDNAAGSLFNNRKTSDSTNAMNDFSTGSFRDSDQSYTTNQDRRGTSAFRNAAEAEGSPFSAGYQDSAMTMDDVKKMLDPGTYARAKNLD